jgi:RHS repeat-associated protein
LDSAFDPHIEFLELAVTASQEGQRVWKVYGPDVSGVYGGAQGVGGLEALVDEATGTSLGVVNDLFGNVAGTVGGDLSFKSSLRVGAYGPLPGQTAVDTGNLLQSLATATVWQGRRLDPTGFYWMGARYYDPGTGRFLSPDPLGHDASLSLYDYAGGDPVNQLDPDGRCVKGVGHGTVDLFKGAWETAYNVGGGIGYRLTGLFSEEAAETVYGEQWRALERTSEGIGKILGGNFEGLGTALTGGEGKSTAYRVGYVVPQIASLLFGGRNLTGTGSRSMAEGTGISAAGTRTAAVEISASSGVRERVLANITASQRARTGSGFAQTSRRWTALDAESGVTTAADDAAFWAGRAGANRAAAESSGLTTLERTPAGRALDAEDLFSKLPYDEAVVPWENLSQRFAREASGTVNAWVGGASPTSVWSRIEKPALMMNPNVRKIIIRDATRPEKTRIIYK